MRGFLCAFLHVFDFTLYFTAWNHMHPTGPYLLVIYVSMYSLAVET